MNTEYTEPNGLVRTLDACAGRLGALDRIIVRTGSVATIALLAVIVLVVGAGVWWRYVLNDSLAWTEEIAKYLMVWMTFVGAPVALSLRGHVGIELFPDALPHRLRQLTYALIHLITLVVMIVLTYYGWKLAMNARTQTAAVVDFSLFFAFVAMPIGTAAMGLLSLTSFFKALAGALGSSNGYQTELPEANAIENE